MAHTFNLARDYHRFIFNRWDSSDKRAEFCSTAVVEKISYDFVSRKPKKISACRRGLIQAIHCVRRIDSCEPGHQRADESKEKKRLGIAFFLG